MQGDLLTSEGTVRPGSVFSCSIIGNKYTSSRSVPGINQPRKKIIVELEEAAKLKGA
jgi:hypothetical protein